MTQLSFFATAESVLPPFMCVCLCVCVCVRVNTLLTHIPCVNIHILHTTSSQRQYSFNQGGINSAITFERLYRVEPLTVGQYISHQSLSGPSKKKTQQPMSLGLSDAWCNTCSTHGELARLRCMANVSFAHA